MLRTNSVIRGWGGLSAKGKCKDPCSILKNFKVVAAEPNTKHGALWSVGPCEAMRVTPHEAGPEDVNSEDSNVSDNKAHV